MNDESWYKDAIDKSKQRDVALIASCFDCRGDFTPPDDAKGGEALRDAVMRVKRDAGQFVLCDDLEAAERPAYSVALLPINRAILSQLDVWGI